MVVKIIVHNKQIVIISGQLPKKKQSKKIVIQMRKPTCKAIVKICTCAAVTFWIHFSLLSAFLVS